MPRSTKVAAVGGELVNAHGDGGDAQCFFCISLGTKSASLWGLKRS
ncbi:MAG: hypothetical protein JWM79_3994 [Nocardioides sp.]|nr:hypothetical protein [Nocardioides sp.]